MRNKFKTESIEDFVSYFPEIELPIQLSEELIPIFSEKNKALSQDAIERYLLQWEQEVTEFTEFVPCFSLPGTEGFSALVYWRAELLNYQFILITIDKKGDLIERKAIASTLIDQELVKKSMALINEDLIIQIVAGVNQESETDYDASHSQAFSMEILPTGKIHFENSDL